MSLIQPTYYVRHPDDTYSVADPQPVASEPSSGEREKLIEKINKQLGDKFDPADCFYEEELLHKAAALLSSDAKPASEPNFVDAYQGAMEEVSIWKRRAMEAEELNRRFIAEINGPTHMGEPVAVPQGLPFDVKFAAIYLDGVMEGEHPEIRAKWEKVSAYLRFGSTSPAPVGIKKENQ